MSSSNGDRGFQVVAIVLAVIGTIAMLCIVGMALMHGTFMGGSMMSGMGR